MYLSDTLVHSEVSNEFNKERKRRTSNRHPELTRHSSNSPFCLSGPNVLVLVPRFWKLQYETITRHIQLAVRNHAEEESSKHVTIADGGVLLPNPEMTWLFSFLFQT
ncbi:hypothetical protein H5410_034745 [Solanum commersonii]|uniref:Uncharacterized protein n=1 Tax=Solanum commersonii TaxID=4109 RepID=A0A9J5YU94_SOLCO|nr:hypothetical protein H5410_034745 [Solanum commersonii]